MLPGNVLSIQLWSTRGDTPLAEQLSTLKSYGYGDVQPFHDQYDEPQMMRDMLDELGLTSRTGHFHLSMFDGKAEPVISAARVLGMQLVVAPWLEVEDRPHDVEGWKAIGSRLRKIKAVIADAGLGFAWHNHDFEFERLDDGSYGIEHLLSDDIDFAMDIGWVFRAGLDPKPWLSRYAGRIPVVHVKDVAKPGENLDEDGFADVGEGTMDWPGLWKAAVAAGSGLMIAEHDAPSDWRRFALTSAKAMRSLSEA